MVVVVVEAEAAEDMVVVVVEEAKEAVEDMVVDKVEVEEVMVEEVSLLMVGEAMVVAALFPPMVEEEGEGEVEDPLPRMVEVEARKPLMEEVAP